MVDPFPPAEPDVAVPPVHRVEHEEPWNALRVDLDVVVGNYRRLQAAFPAAAPLYIVLKADAYGHGLVEVGRSLVLAGCRRLAVETPQEGIRLRKEGIEEEILLLNPIPSWMTGLAVHYGFTVTAIHESILPPLAAAARSRGRECPVHLNVNVGLHRMGIAPSRLTRIAKQVQATDGLQLAGMYAQPRDNHSARDSFARLVELHRNLAARDLAPPLVHFANSTTFLAHGEMACIGARLGILVYGILPPEDAGGGPPALGLRPAMTVTTEVVQLRTLAPGSRIGYRARARTTRETRVATVPMGYAHGLDRKLAKEGCVLLQGRRVPFIGAISMNSATLDITDLDGVGIGDTVTVLGRQGDEEISANMLADMCNTIAAEILVRFGQGIARRYSAVQDAAPPAEKPDPILAGHRLYRVESELDLPEKITLTTLADFIRTQEDGLEATSAEIYERLGFSLGLDPTGTGLVLLAVDGAGVSGILVAASVDTPGRLPESTIVHLCVHRNHRRQGLGTRMVRELAGGVTGRITLRIPARHPGAQFLERAGFTLDNVEYVIQGEEAWQQSMTRSSRTRRPGTAARINTNSRS